MPFNQELSSTPEKRPLTSVLTPTRALLTSPTQVVTPGGLNPDAVMPRDLLKNPPEHNVLSDQWDIAIRVKNGSQELLPLSKTPIKQRSSRFNLTSQEFVQPLQTLRETPRLEREALFKTKLTQCCKIYDFLNQSSDVAGKESKRETLVELVEYVCSDRQPFSEDIYPIMIKMLSINLFRAFTPQLNPLGDLYDPEEDEPVLELAWPHLQIVYELFWRWLETPDFNQSFSKNYLDTQFVVQLIDLFGSEDPREREMLKGVLHRLYSKILHLRPLIRRQIGFYLSTFTYEVERHNGIAELLEILGSIINGFALPIKEEHRQFFFKVIIPLHKARSLSLFHAQLGYCVAQFLSKDVTMGEIVIRKLLKFWPKVNSGKEVLFLGEMEELLTLLNPVQFTRIRSLVFTRLARCIASPHFQVAERALLYWANPAIVRLIQEHVHVIFPLVYGALYKSSRSHWNRNILNLCTEILKAFMDMDQKLFDDCANKFEVTRQVEKSKSKTRKRQWQELEDCALKQSGKFVVKPMLDKMSEDELVGSAEDLFELIHLKAIPGTITRPDRADIRRKSMLPGRPFRS